MKKFRGHVQFYAIEVTVSAKNKREAKKKIKARAMKLKPKIQNNQLWIDEMQEG